MTPGVLSPFEAITTPLFRFDSFFFHEVVENFPQRSDILADVFLFEQSAEQLRVDARFFFDNVVSRAQYYLHQHVGFLLPGEFRGEERFCWGFDVFSHDRRSYLK